jgi:hypothetical protein
MRACDLVTKACKPQTCICRVFEVIYCELFRYANTDVASFGNLGRCLHFEGEHIIYASFEASRHHLNLEVIARDGGECDPLVNLPHDLERPIPPSYPEPD